MSFLTEIIEKLSNNVTLVSLVGDRIYKEELEVDIKGTGYAAISVSVSGGASPGSHSWRNPRVEIAIYADNTRNASGLPISADTGDRMQAIYKVLDSELHFFDGEVQDWGPNRVLRSLREGEPRVLWDPNADTPALVVSYNVTYLD